MYTSLCCEKARVRLVGTCAVRWSWRHGVFVACCTMECNRVVLLLPAVQSLCLRVSTAGPSRTSSASRWCAARLRKALGESLVGRQRSAAQGSSRACCARLARRFACRHHAPAVYGLQLLTATACSWNLLQDVSSDNSSCSGPQQRCMSARAPLGHTSFITHDPYTPDGPFGTVSYGLY